MRYDFPLTKIGRALYTTTGTDHDLNVELRFLEEKHVREELRHFGAAILLFRSSLQKIELHALSQALSHFSRKGRARFS